MTDINVVYRFFDACNELLYVGSSDNLGARIYNHERSQPWWHLVVNIEIERCKTREEAEAKERLYIITERPRYNVAYNEMRKKRNFTRQTKASDVVMETDQRADSPVKLSVSSTSGRVKFVELLLQGRAEDEHGPKWFARQCGHSECTIHRWLNRLVVAGMVTHAGYGRYKVTQSNVTLDEMLASMVSNGPVT